VVSSADQTQELSNDTQLPSRTVTIAFQGEPGAFGDEAVRAYFNREELLKPSPIPYRSFADVFRAVAVGEVDYGLVPVENSQAGSINDVYDLLRQHDLFIIGEMSHDNYTRFIAIGREPAPRREGPAKTMLVMATSHQPGSLYKCLGVLAAKQINLLKLESRPSRQHAWEYVFYLDLEGHREDPPVRSALADLAGYTTFCKVLGSFAKNL